MKLIGVHQRDIYHGRLNRRKWNSQQRRGLVNPPVHVVGSFIYSVLPRNTIPRGRSSLEIRAVALFARYRKSVVNLMISLVRVGNLIIRRLLLVRGWRLWWPEVEALSLSLSPSLGFLSAAH